MKIKLNREEIKNICKITDKFQDIDYFEIRQESTGIGIATLVRILKEEDSDFPTVIEMDITNYNKW